MTETSSRANFPKILNTSSSIRAPCSRKYATPHACCTSSKAYFQLSAKPMSCSKPQACISVCVLGRRSCYKGKERLPLPRRYAQNTGLVCAMCVEICSHSVSHGTRVLLMNSHGDVDMQSRNPLEEEMLLLEDAYYSHHSETFLERLRCTGVQAHSLWKRPCDDAL